MSDGRLFGDFKTATRRNEQIKYVNNVYRDDEYRQLLQRNGVEIMRQNANLYKKQQCSASACVHQYPTRVTPAQQREELAAYNASRSGGQTVSCQVLEDYRASEY